MNYIKYLLCLLSKHKWFVAKYAKDVYWTDDKGGSVRFSDDCLLKIMKCERCGTEMIGK